MLKSRTRIVRRPNKALKYIKTMKKLTNKANTLVVGLPKGSNDYPDGTSVVMVGIVHEFGMEEKGIPERSFLRSTVVEQRQRIRSAMKRILKKMVEEGLPTERGLQELGVILSELVRSKISDGIQPQLKTREGTPLWDTGHLIRAITYEVRNAD